MEIKRIEKRKIAQFRAGMYKHVKDAHYKSCWKCDHSFAIGEPVSVCLTRTHGNFAICSNCARTTGLLDMADKRGFVNFESVGGCDVA